MVKDMACDLFPTMKKSNDEVWAWAVDDIFSEHQISTALACNIVARTLLSDTPHAIKKCVVAFKERIDVLSKQPNNTKECSNDSSGLLHICSICFVGGDKRSFVKRVTQ